LPLTAIGDAGRYRVSVRTLVASRNAGFLLSAAAHGRGESRPGTKQPKANQGRGNQRIKGQPHVVTNITLLVDSIRQLRSERDFALNQIRVSERG
jgi:hypothetical protein